MIVTVVPDIAGLDGKRFDYLVPEHLRDQVRVGSIVRVTLAGRRVRAWVVDVDAAPPAGVALKPIAKVTGWGPSAEVIELAEWGAWRWAGRLVHLLDTASPPGAVTSLPPAGPSAHSRRTERRSATPVASSSVRLVEIPPATDVLPLALEAAAYGDALIVAPSVDAARAVATGLRQAGVSVALLPRDWAAAAAGGRCVVGARAAVWGPVPNLAAVLVLDEHDESLQEERAPTWHARDVAIERARRAGVPCVLASPVPSLAARRLAVPQAPPTSARRSGWPIVDVVDRRREDPRKAGLFSPRLVSLLRDPDRGRVVCVLNRTGRARLLACVACGEVARCERCDAAVEQPADETVLRCRRCGTERVVVCQACGSARFRNLRAGVSRVREELAALAGERVGEITAKEPVDPDARIVVGTEAVLHQVSAPVGVVAFLDIDQELLAPRYAAAEQALGLLARAARLLGGRDAGGRLLVQTRDPRHPVLDAVLHADPDRFAAPELANRQALRFPPVTALAAVSGAAADEFIKGLGSPPGVEVLGPADGRWLLRAGDHHTLCDALAATLRPPGRLRVEVDPARL